MEHLTDDEQLQLALRRSLEDQNLPSSPPRHRRSPPNPNVIDLTDSPPPSPRASTSSVPPALALPPLSKGPSMAEQLAERKRKYEGESGGSGKRHGVGPREASTSSGGGGGFGSFGALMKAEQEGPRVGGSGSWSGSRAAGGRVLGASESSAFEGDYGGGEDYGAYGGGPGAFFGGVPAVEPIEIEFPDGALRITQTPGRTSSVSSKNTYRLDRIVRPASLVQAFIFSYYYGQKELFDYFPLEGTPNALHARRDVKIYAGRDINQDPYLGHPQVVARAEQAGLDTSFSDGQARVKGPDHEAVAAILTDVYRQQLGSNYRAIYLKSSGGCIHSKLMALVYASFLRFYVTSSNLMAIDLIGSDNGACWYDVPLLLRGQSHVTTEFETGFLHHLAVLGAPPAFLDSIRGRYNYSKVRIHLITSERGTRKGNDLEKFGILRLAAVARQVIPPSARLAFEICTASVGHLSEESIKMWTHFASGGTTEGLAEAKSRRRLPELELVYPSQANGDACSEEVREAASNMGFHSPAGWNKLPSSLKALFRQYKSKDFGRLSHLKSYLILDDSTLHLDPPPPPHLLILGSANWSQNAWGKVSFLANGTPKIEMENHECSVAIEGKDIVGMLERGSEWEDVVPYQRELAPYTLSGAGKWDKPWSSGAWGKKPEGLGE